MPRLKRAERLNGRLDRRSIQLCAWVASLAESAQRGDEGDLVVQWSPLRWRRECTWDRTRGRDQRGRRGRREHKGWWRNHGWPWRRNVDDGRVKSFRQRCSGPFLLVLGRSFIALASLVPAGRAKPLGANRRRRRGGVLKCRPRMLLANHVQNGFLLHLRERPPTVCPTQVRCSVGDAPGALVLLELRFSWCKVAQDALKRLFWLAWRMQAARAEPVQVANATDDLARVAHSVAFRVRR